LSLKNKDDLVHHASGAIFISCLLLQSSVISPQLLINWHGSNNPPYSITPVSIVLNFRTGMIFRVQYLATMSVIVEADSDHEPEPPPPVLTEVNIWVQEMHGFNSDLRLENNIICFPVLFDHKVDIYVTCVLEPQHSMKELHRNM
jgi:hypothetical protein